MDILRLEYEDASLFAQNLIFLDFIMPKIMVICHLFQVKNIHTKI